MSDRNNKTKLIDLGDNFGDVVFSVNSATIEVGADSHVIVSTRGGVTLRPSANDGEKPKAKRAPEIGDEMEDGTILAGYFEGSPLYATPRDAPAMYSFNEAAKYAKALDAHGHQDFRAPSKGELSILWENRNKGKLAGTFNEAAWSPAGWYLSSTPYFDDGGWAQRFSDGLPFNAYRDNAMALRCVRA